MFYFSIIWKNVFPCFKYGWCFHRDCMIEFCYLSWHSLVLTNYLIPKIFSEQQEGPLTSYCAVWSIIFYLYCNPLLVTLYLSYTRIFDCAFLWIWEKCTDVLLSSYLYRLLDVPNHIHLALFGSLYLSDTARPSVLLVGC